jgi:hypothetical protein
VEPGWVRSLAEPRDRRLALALSLKSDRNRPRDERVRETAVLDAGEHLRAESIVGGRVPLLPDGDAAVDRVPALVSSVQDRPEILLLRLRREDRINLVDEQCWVMRVDQSEQRRRRHARGSNPPTYEVECDLLGARLPRLFLRAVDADVRRAVGRLEGVGVRRPESQGDGLGLGGEPDVSAVRLANIVEEIGEGRRRLQIV